MHPGSEIYINQETSIYLVNRPQIMEGSTGNSKNVSKKEYQFGQNKGLSAVHGCEPKSLQPACIKFSNFMLILDTSIVTTRTFITSATDYDSGFHNLGVSLSQNWVIIVYLTFPWF